MRETVRANINYTGAMSETPRYHACDHSRDVHVLDPHSVEIENVRPWREVARLEREGFTLVPHRSRVREFTDPDEVRRVYVSEAEQLIRDVTGACATVVVAAPFVRFAERSPLSGKLSEWLGVRLVTAGGVAIVGVGLLLIGATAGQTSLVSAEIGLTLTGAGMGLATGPLMGEAVGAVPPARSGTASALVNVARMVGATVGVAALGACAGSS